MNKEKRRRGEEEYSQGGDECRMETIEAPPSAEEQVSRDNSKVLRLRKQTESFHARV